MLAQQTVRSGLCENNLRADPVDIIVIITSLYHYSQLTTQFNNSIKLQVKSQYRRHNVLGCGEW